MGNPRGKALVRRGRRFIPSRSDKPSGHPFTIRCGYPASPFGAATLVARESVVVVRLFPTVLSTFALAPCSVAVLV